MLEQQKVASKESRKQGRKAACDLYSKGAMKRSVEDAEFDISEMHAAKHAKVHGVMTSLSPMKESKKGSKYFIGSLSDGKSSARFVCFDKKLHETLSCMGDKKQPMMMSNCEVKESTYSSGLEVVVRNSSEVHMSPRKMEVPDSVFCKPRENVVTLEEVCGLGKGEVVAVRAKVLKEEDATEVKKGLVKQEYWIVDCSGSCKIVVWQDNVGVFVVGKSYKLCGLIVRTFKDKKYLSVPSEGFTAMVIDAVESVEEEATERKYTQVYVEGVKSIERFSSCYSCSGKVNPKVESSKIGICTKCGTQQRLDRCKESLTARLDLNIGSDEVITVVAFGDVLNKMCNGNVTVEALLDLEDFDATVSNTNILIHIGLV